MRIELQHGVVRYVYHMFDDESFSRIFQSSQKIHGGTFKYTFNDCDVEAESTPRMLMKEPMRIELIARPSNEGYVPKTPLQVLADSSVVMHRGKARKPPGTFRSSSCKEFKRMSLHALVRELKR